MGDIESHPWDSVCIYNDSSSTQIIPQKLSCKLWALVESVKSLDCRCWQDSHTRLMPERIYFAQRCANRQFIPPRDKGETSTMSQWECWAKAVAGALWIYKATYSPIEKHMKQVTLTRIQSRIEMDDWLLDWCQLTLCSASRFLEKHRA